MDTYERRSAPIAAWLLLCLGVAYLPDIGHGFISDDFGWLAHSRISGLGDLWRLLSTAPTGFYRPVVSLSFMLNQGLAGLAYVVPAPTSAAVMLAGGAMMLRRRRAR